MTTDTPASTDSAQADASAFEALEERFCAGQLTADLTYDDQDNLRQQIIDLGPEEALETVKRNNPPALKLVETHVEFLKNKPREAYLHSALCALSLPTSKPDDEYAKIVRKDELLTLTIRPKPIDKRDGTEHKVGVPYGPIARLILIHIISEAVKNKSRRVYVGRSFRGFMRRLGYKSFGGGQGGSMTRFKEQLLRLAQTEWSIVFDREDMYDGANGRGMESRSMPLTTGMVFWDALVNNENSKEPGQGPTIEAIELSQEFYDHVIRHKVQFNEAALIPIKKDATALDLYTFLAFRLPLIEPGERLFVPWDMLQSLLGTNYKQLRQFKAHILKKLPQVKAVYPGARVIDLKEGLELFSSPPALQNSGETKSLSA